MKRQRATAADIQDKEPKKHSHCLDIAGSHENGQWDSAIKNLRRCALKNGTPNGLYIDDGKAISLVRQ